MKKMKVSLSNLLFVNYPVEEAVRLGAESGAEGVEIIHDAPHFSPGYDQRKLRGLKEILDSYGLGVSVHGSFWDLNPASHHPEIQKLTLDLMCKSIDACRTLGGEIVVVHFGKCPVPDVFDFFEKARQRYREYVEQCLAYARDRGVVVALENGGGKSEVYPSTLEELKKLVLEIEGAKITFDIGHAHLAERRAGREDTGGRIAELIKDARDYIVHFHMHDNTGKSDEHLIPGGGEINFDPIIKAIKQINYSGFVVAELWNPKDPIETGKRGIAKIKKIFRD